MDFVVPVSPNSEAQIPEMSNEVVILLTQWIEMSIRYYSTGSLFKIERIPSEEIYFWLECNVATKDDGAMIIKADRSASKNCFERTIYILVPLYITRLSLTPAS